MSILLIPLIAYSAVGFLVLHKVNDVGSRRDVEYLHERVVQRDEVHEQIQVPHAEHQQVDFLGLGRQTYKGLDAYDNITYAVT